MKVLAVGDTEFPKKCLGKMDQVSKEGRTVLFVSHNMAAIQQLCQLGIVLNQGELAFLGDKQTAINKYLNNIKDIQIHNLAERNDRKGEQWLRFTDVSFYDMDGNEVKQVIAGQDLNIKFYYVSKKEVEDANINIAFNVRSNHGYLLTNLNSVDVGCGVLNIHHSGYFQCTWPNFNLRAGSYDCTLFCSVNGEIVDWIQSAFSIPVEDGDFFHTGRIITRDQGNLLVNNVWKSVKC
jgi:lipopolysaccharide transport system ATP-binding protein